MNHNQFKSWNLDPLEPRHFPILVRSHHWSGLDVGIAVWWQFECKHLNKQALNSNSVIKLSRQWPSGLKILCANGSMNATVPSSLIEMVDLQADFLLLSWAIWWGLQIVLICSWSFHCNHHYGQKNVSTTRKSWKWSLTFTHEVSDFVLYCKRI